MYHTLKIWILSNGFNVGLLENSLVLREITWVISVAGEKISIVANEISLVN